MQQVASSRRIFPGGMRRLGSACREEHRELLQPAAYAEGSGLPSLVEMCSGVFVKQIFLQLDWQAVVPRLLTTAKTGAS